VVRRLFDAEREDRHRDGRARWWFCMHCAVERN
jgi:hypothetical protein